MGRYATHRGPVNKENPYPLERGELFNTDELRRLFEKTLDLANSHALQQRMRQNPDFCAATHRLWGCRWFSAEHGFNLETRRGWAEPLSEVIRKLEARGFPTRGKL